MNGSMDVLHGEQEAELFSEHSYMLKAGDGDYMYVVKWLKHSLVPRLPHTGIVKVEAACMVLPNRGKFSLVQIFVEMRPNPSEEIFTVFIFTERKCDALTTDDGVRWYFVYIVAG